MQLTARKGMRSSTAVAFLRPAEKRRNLTVETNSHATRVLLEGRRATGVEYECGGQRVVAKARGEVILSGGAINSPQLLQLSGLGPAEHLRDIGVEVVADMPDVGRNLQDHFNIRMVYRCNRPITLNDSVRHPLRGVREAANFAFRRRGFFAMGASVAEAAERVGGAAVDASDASAQRWAWCACFSLGYPRSRYRTPETNSSVPMRRSSGELDVNMPPPLDSDTPLSSARALDMATAGAFTTAGVLTGSGARAPRNAAALDSTHAIASRDMMHHSLGPRSLRLVSHLGCQSSLRAAATQV